MVRETRHLWVGNLPDNIREDRIREHFKRYGRVQNVKLLGRTENAVANASAGPSTNASGATISSGCGICATVAFMDIKSASKAHNAEHVLDERTLTTEYYEPAAIPSATGAPSAGSSPAGSGYSGSSSSVNSAPAPVSAPRYHLSGGEENSNNACAMATAAAPANWRGTNDSATEYCRRGNTPASYGRTTPHHRWYGSAERTGGATGGESTPSTPGAPEGRRRRNSGSGTSRSDSSSPEPSDTSRASTPAASHNHHHHSNHRLLPPHHQWAATASGRPLAICVRNLPTRSTDSSLKDGLYHEYKKHGKVVWVKVVGQNADRYAVVRFKKPSDVEKALEVSQDKLFFGCKISVAPHQSCDEDADTAKPYETDIDEYHPKATKTLFIGNLEKDVTQQQLREKFKHFGRIIEIDIKKGSSGGAGYAFCQYASISSVVEAIRVMDGEYVGGSRVKLGFGKPVATTCVWVDGLSEHTEKQVLGAVARCGAATSVCVDRAAGAALVHFEQAAAAGAAVRELRRVAALASAMEPDHPRLCVDYASRECQDAFYEQLEKHGGSAALASSERLSGDVSTRYAPTTRHDSLRYDGTGPRSRGSSYGRASSRTPRYSSIEHYDPAEYAADRRYRVYEELGSSPPAEETSYEDRLQSVVVSPHRARRHRRDSTPEERKHSKERHRSAGVRRSRSGSRRHRRRREGSGGTPLRDELDVPVEPRRPPRDRPPLPMSLPLPKFAAQLLRTAPTAPRPAPTPAPAPASPPRPPSASSSSGGSAPHSPSLEERIRSLNEKYEKWNGSRAAPDAPDRSRLRHRLLEVDINEVKPSEVVRSLLAKRSVFDEDSERLEGATRAPSPVGSPRPRSSPSTPRSHRYSFPTHLPAHGDPRLERPERPYKPELLTKLNELDYGFEPRSRHRTPSTDKSQIDTSERRHTPPLERDRAKSDRECRKETDIGDSLHTVIDNDSKFDSSTRDTKNIVQVPENDYQNSEKIQSTIDEILESSERTITAVINEKMNVLKEHVNVTGDSFTGSNVFELKSDCLNISPSVQNCYPSEDSSIKSDFGIKCEPLKPEEPKPLDSDNKFYFSKHPVKSEDDKCKDIFIQNHIKKELAEFEAQQNKLNISNTLKSIKGISDTSHDTVKANEKNNKERFNQNVILEAIQNNKLEKENIHFDKLPEEEKLTSSNTVFFDSKMFVSEKVPEDKSKIDCDKTRPHKDRLDKDKHNLDKTITSKSEKTINKNDTKEKNLKEDNQEDLRHSIDKTDKNKVERDIEKLHKGKGDRDSERSIRDYDKFNNDNEKSSRDNEKCSRDHEKSNRDSEKSTRDFDKFTRDFDKSNRDSEKSSRDPEKSSRDLEKSTRELEKSKHSEEKLSRTDHHRKEKSEKDKRKDNMEFDFLNKVRRDDKYKHDRTKKDIHDSKRDRKDADSIKNRKSSRDETSRDLCRKDSTDSSASRTSHDSVRLKDFDHSDMKDENKVKLKSLNEGGINKIKNEKDLQMKNSIINCTVNCHKLDESVKLKPDEKGNVEETSKSRSDHLENVKPKDLMEKQRHYSLDSPSVDSKRKERLNSCSSLPSNISYKRRMSSQDSFDSLNEESKKVRNETKIPERRDSRDNRSLERHKTTKFNKGHFAKIIESKTKDDKKNQVKPPDANCSEWKSDIKELKQTDRTKLSKRSPKGDHEEKFDSNSDIHHEGLQNDLDFLATLELRSSEEDEKQRALRKEMKEKKRIQQLQQIQELQMKQDALQQAEIVNKLKEDKKQKADEKKKEIAREKRFSTDRKSREDKIDPHKRKNRKQMQSTDSSDSDEPKKHSIFDIVDDEPTYISMYDKVKARSCKNMQKQEEEKRQEKIKAKFSQLKQSRAKREEKKRSSWDEDSDSDQERRKSQKNSMGSSSDDDQNKKRNKPHRLSLDYDCNKSSDFFYLPNNEEDSRNKLSRKNSRTRIMSDSSDDEVTKRSSSKSPNYLSEVKKELISDSETLLVAKDDIDTKRSNCDRIKKSSLLNLFGKSDSDDIKIKPRLELDNDYKSGFLHLNCNDFSSESESVISNRLSEEIRKKHKRKQKKHKFSFSDDEIKKGNNDTTITEDTGNKHSEKPRRHSNKKDKRKDKNRESFDTDETRDEKVKLKKKKSIMANFDVLMDIPTNSIKKEGKMEDIFGPLSDESDKERSRIRNNSTDYNCYDISYHTVNDEIKSLYPVDEAKLKERDDNKRKKEKRRKEKRYIAKDDENSLDVDAVSKAIEARLFADTISDDDNRVISESHNTVTTYDQKDLKHLRNDSLNESINDHSDKNIDKIKKDFREKKKKKKKYREDRQSRKDHQYFHHHDAPEKTEHSKETPVEQTISQNNLLLDIPLPKDAPIINTNDDTTDSILLEPSSLPRLTESPPGGTNNLRESTDTKSTSDTIDCLTVDENESKFITCNNIEMKDIPMPPPIENMVQDINSVPLPSEPLPINNSELSKSDNFPPSFVGDDEISENAVRSISNLENETESTKTKNDSQTCKPEDIAEKPRAIISQEETEDAVAALLGESFGGKDNTFETRYEEVQTNTSIKTEIGSSIIENENIPEEDAEEMRQAVQNLNASEMEVKPDTPVSDNDLLLIDTDTEETDEAPINAKATNQTLSINITDQPKTTEMSNTDNNILLSKPKSTVVLSTPNELDVTGKPTESDIKIALTKRETVQQATSTATPVITSWTLANHKLIDPHVLNIQKSQLTTRESESKSNVTANIVQLKGSQNQPLQMNTPPRPIITSNRINTPSYQVINQMMRPQISNMQPPTIKIPEPHILYQKSQGIVISPRTSNDVRLQSPKASPQNENITSPRLANMTILSTSPPVINSVGIPSPNALQQRSPGQVTVVRMQQPPLSPIQAVHLPPGARAMVSPNRPNSVLVQQGTPIHFNRLPVTPVLTPISKQITSSAIVQQNKGIVVNSSPLIHQQKVITAGDFRKNDPRIITDSVNESSKIILSPTNLQQSTNPTVMAQNRLISMQNAMLINNMNQMNEKRDHIQKPEQHNHISFNTTPIIHVTAVNHSTSSIIHSATKSAMCSLQEGVPLRGQTANVIHTLNSQKLLTTTPMTNVIQLEKNKTQPSVLSMATIRPPSVLTKLESSKSVAITTSTLTNVVMTPLLLKSTNASGTVRLNTLKQEKDFLENKVLAKPNHLDTDTHEKNCSKISTIVYDSPDKHRDSPIKPTTSPVDHLAKCETDFEELLKDNTNEIKISNDTEKKLEVNVGKIVTLLPTTTKERKSSIDSIANEIFNKDIPITKEPAIEVQIFDNDAELVNGQEENQQNQQDSTVNATPLGNTESEKVVTENITRQDEVATSTNNNDLNKISKEINVKHTFKTHEVSVTTCGDKSAQSGNSKIQIKNSDEVGLRNTKDINVESVIKKVDVLCHDLGDTKDMKNKEIIPEVIKESSNNLELSASINKPELTAETKLESVSKSQPESNVELDPTEGLCIERGSSFHKRGGRSGRGKRSEKNPDRVQTRQIAKPPRNATSAKRGRGRAKLDKKVKNIASNMTNNIPGDVYDFHEDSGEEDSTSSNKSETRPRLILTIKSPLSGNCNAIATSTLSITQKEQLKGNEKLCKNEKAEDFASPSLNTRKSRRLQEKDVARGSGEDSGENSSPVKVPRENKKKSPKQGGPKGNQIGALDTRKSPRGAKRTRDRSLSTASIDSNEDKLANRADDGPREAKVPKLAESPSKILPTEVDSHALPKSTSVISSQPAMSPAAPAPAPTPAPIPMPITKPPKKMISEIAKLGGAFEGTPLRGLASPNVLEPSTERTIGDNEKQAAGGERRLVDNVPVNMVPVGATEATDARVQSPALPHVPQASSAPHRPADRATPILIRGGESEGCGGVAGVASGAGVCAGGVAAGARGAGSRGFVATPSLPRGAHLPTHPHHAGSGSRVNITSIPTLSPQGPGPLSADVVRSPPPAHQQATPITPVYHNGEGMYFSHQHYHVYQHHFRATQHENRATPPYTRSLEAEGSEAPTPPLELRRPPTARVPRPAHSPLPADRHIMYAAGCGRSPPPAHGTSRMPGALPPLTAPGPPHASQVPREADSLQMLLRRYPVMWQGLLALKNDSAAVQMHFVGGNPRVAGETLPRHTDGSTPPLRIAQRMRLEPIQLDQVHRKMKVEHEHCILLALPCGRDHMDVLQQSTNLTAGFITYMQRKQAAGIVNIAPPGHDQALYTVHIFPSCDFANEKLSRIAPDLMHRVADIAHLLIVIATV